MIIKEINEDFEEGENLYFGRRGVWDVRTAAKIFKIHADRDHPRACLLFGDMNWNQSIVDNTVKELGKQYLLKAFELGDPIARAVCYYDGLGRKKDQNRAYDMLEKGGLWKTDPIAMSVLAYMLDNSIGCIRNPKRAGQLYEQSAREGCIIAMANAGYIYEEGIVVPKDIAKASDYYQLSAQHGCIFGMIRVAMLICNTHQTDRYEEAFQFISEAVEHGNAYAEYWKGMMQSNALGTETNAEGAMLSFRHAAEAGCTQAMEAFADYCSIPNDSSQPLDGTLAMKWAKLAYTKGGYSFTTTLMRLYRTGFGCPVDRECALSYERAWRQQCSDPPAELMPEEDWVFAIN